MILWFPRAKHRLCHTKHGGAGGINLWPLLTVFLVNLMHLLISLFILENQLLFSLRFSINPKQHFKLTWSENTIELKMFYMIVFLISKSMFWYNHSFEQMCILISIGSQVSEVAHWPFVDKHNVNQSNKS